MGTLGVWLRHELVLTGIGIGDGELTAGVKRRLLGDHTGGGTADLRLVVGAVDGDGELVGGAIDGGNGEAVGELVAMGQALHSRLLVVEAVAPRAIGLHGKTAMGALGVWLRHELVLTGIGIGDGELTAGVKRRLLGDSAGGGTADLGLVVGAVDGDGELVGGAIDGGNGEAVGELVAMGQALHSRLLVVEAVAPRAIGLHGKTAMGALGVWLRHELVLTGIGIGDGELTAGVKRRLLGDSAGGGTADLRLVIGAVDGDGELVGGAIDGGNGEAVGELVAMGQALHRRLLVVEAVAP